MRPHDHLDLAELLEHQSGVISRKQLLEHASTSDLKRWLRRRELVPVHDGVYVDHTGTLTWDNRAWAAVLRYSPAALAHASATRLDGEVIHVAVAEGRHFGRVVSGVRVHRLRDFDRRVQWNRSPPRQRYEDAVISQCDRAESRTQVLDLISDACRSRLTTAERLAEDLARRPSIKDRDWISRVLDDVASGVHSVLESTYLDRVERAHGLPTGRRQERARDSAGVIYRDVLYDDAAVAVELDGRLGHESNRDRWDDMDRDLDAAVDALLTVRLGWRHAEREPCRTAVRLGLVLRARGWPGRPRRCGPDCSVEV
jgi:hypothetical protein